MVLLVAVACVSKPSNKHEILDKIMALPEVKKEIIRIDSLKASGMKVDIQFGIVSNSFYPEDTLKNLSLCLIEEDYGFDQIPLLEVKFDKTTGEIVSVARDKWK